jgi:hypothetical protein
MEPLAMEPLAMEFVTRMTYPILLDFFNGPAARTPNPFGLAPSSKAADVRLMTATKLVAPPDDIILGILCILYPDLYQMADFTTPLFRIRNKAYIINAMIALII